MTFLLLLVLLPALAAVTAALLIQRRPLVAAAIATIAVLIPIVAATLTLALYHPNNPTVGEQLTRQAAAHFYFDLGLIFSGVTTFIGAGLWFLYPRHSPLTPGS